MPITLTDLCIYGVATYYLFLVTHQKGARDQGSGKEWNDPPLPYRHEKRKYFVPRATRLKTKTSALISSTFKYGDPLTPDP